MDKPVPKPNADSRPYWEACNRSELVYQRCDACGHAQFYPRSLCVQCQSSMLSWQRSTGRATVYSFTEVHRAAIPAYQDDVPYLVVLLELEEGFRLMTNVDGPNNRVRIGTKGHIVFEARGEQQVPRFRPDI